MRIKSSAYCLVVSSVIVLTSCGRPAASTSAVTEPHYPTIVRLENRHYSIVISAGPRTPVYSIATSAGEMLVENISLSDLRESRPELYNLVAPALAPNGTASAAGPEAAIYADNR